MFLWNLELGVWDLFQSVHIILGLGVIYEFCGIGAIKIFFEIGVAVAIEVLGSVGRIIGIEAVFFLPFIRHAVMVAVQRRGSGFVFGPAANILRSRDDAVLAELHCAGANLLDYASVDGIPLRQSRAGLSEHELVGFGCA